MPTSEAIRGWAVIRSATSSRMTWPPRCSCDAGPPTTAPRSRGSLFQGLRRIFTVLLIVAPPMTTTVNLAATSDVVADLRNLDPADDRRTSTVRTEDLGSMNFDAARMTTFIDNRRENDTLTIQFWPAHLSLTAMKLCPMAKVDALSVTFGETEFGWPGVVVVVDVGALATRTATLCTRARF